MMESAPPCRDGRGTPTPKEHDVLQKLLGDDAERGEGVDVEDDEATNLAYLDAMGDFYDEQREVVRKAIFLAMQCWHHNDTLFRPVRNAFTAWVAVAFRRPPFRLGFS